MALLNIQKTSDNREAIAFCRQFLEAKIQERYLFGCNDYSRNLARLVDVAAFIDDFTRDRFFSGKPVIRSEDLPPGSWVVSAVVLGRPLSARNRLARLPVHQLDYFAFYRYSGVAVPPVMFWDLFKEDFDRHQDRYQHIFDLLSDDESKRTYEKMLNFRLSGDLSHMEGFTDRQAEQYFEDFLKLRPAGEVFVDVGGFDGYTTREFIRRCPDYRAAHVFEPEPANMAVAQSKLAGAKNVAFHALGLSDKSGHVAFASKGSASSIAESGDIQIPVAALDDVVSSPVTFIKMDIEGGEKSAIEGARQTILKNHPRLALSVYHLVDDLWKIPERVFSIRKDYALYLRHYTEGVTETVMFFIPKNA